MINYLINSAIYELDYEILSFSVVSDGNETTIIVKLKITHGYHETIKTVTKTIKEEEK